MMGPPQERVRELVTPAGVPIRFAVAPAGDRVGALVLDLLLIVGMVVVLVVPLVWLAVRGIVPPDLIGAAAILATFLIWTFYFAFFELSWQGQTPGKRKLRLRVVDASGGPLRAEAVLARNLTREAELLLPLLALSGGAEAIFPGAPGMAQIAAVGWLLLFGFLPLFNRDRLRIGDLLAGTMVVRQPEAVLLEDLSARPPARADGVLRSMRSQRRSARRSAGTAPPPPSRSCARSTPPCAAGSSTGCCSAAAARTSTTGTADGALEGPNRTPSRARRCRRLPSRRGGRGTPPRGGASRAAS